MAPSLLYVVSDASSTSTLVHQPSASSDSSSGDKNEQGLHTNGGVGDNELPAASEFKKNFATVRAQIK